MESVNYVDSRAIPLADCDQRRTERMKYEFFWFLDGNGILPKRPIDRGWTLFLQIIDFGALLAVSLVHGAFLMKVATIFLNPEAFWRRRYSRQQALDRPRDQSVSRRLQRPCCV